jgi:predicted nucleic acid-binding protein
MRVLIDTNLIIGREDHVILDVDLRTLYRLLNEHAVQLLVHPVTAVELERDRDPERREVILAKLPTYAVLGQPPEPDEGFRRRSAEGTRPNDSMDTLLLFALHSNAVDFLITNDRGLLDRAARIQCQDRAFSAATAVEYFSQLFGREIPSAPTYLHHTPVNNLDLADSFFDSFRRDYPGFDGWLRKIARQGRMCVWVPDRWGHLGALMIYKEEEEAFGPLPKSRRLKICSFKVSEGMARQRLSELLLDFAFGFCARNRLTECYLTVYPHHSGLIEVLELFGFRDAGPTGNSERLFVKGMVPQPGEALQSPGEFFRRYFPGYIDDSNVRKFLVPVQPRWHELLFPEYVTHPEQPTLERWGGGDPLFRLNPAGNAIRKAYLCNAGIRKIRTGDILLFYRSQDVHLVTHVGVAESAVACRSVPEIVDLVGNRTVLPLVELERLCKGEVLAILFWRARRVGRDGGPGLPLGEAVPFPPQTIIELQHQKYLDLCRIQAPRS